MASTSSDHTSSNNVSSNPTSSSQISCNQQTVEFYLSSLWSWLPEGSKRILEALESCDLEQAHFVWDEECDWFHIQCLEVDKDYIMNEYLKVQNKLENELREKDVVYGGSLVPNDKNDLVGKLQLRSRVTASDDSGTSEETDSTEERVDIRYPKGHSPIKNANNRRPKGHGPVKKVVNIQNPEGQSPAKKTIKRQARNEKEYGF